jgi:hypothetical protein
MDDNRHLGGGIFLAAKKNLCTLLKTITNPALHMWSNNGTVEQLCIKTAIHQNGYSSKRLFIETAIHQNGYSSKWLFIETAIHQNSYSLKRLFIKTAFHQSGFSPSLHVSGSFTALSNM